MRRRPTETEIRTYREVLAAVTRRLRAARQAPEGSYVHLAGETATTLTVTVWHPDGSVADHIMPRMADTSARRRQTVRTGLDSSTATSLVSLLLAPGTPPRADHVLETIGNVADLIATVRGDKETHQLMRNNALCTLSYFYGWTAKKDLYDLVDISRTELDGAIQSFSLGERTQDGGGGELTGEAVRNLAVAYDEAYRRADRQEETLTAFRDMLIIDLRHGQRYDGTFGPSLLAEHAMVSHARIVQICTPGYRAEHAERKRLRDRAYSHSRRRSPAA